VFTSISELVLIFLFSCWAVFFFEFCGFLQDCIDFFKYDSTMPAIAIAPRIIQGIAEVGVLVHRSSVPKHEIIEAFLVSMFSPKACLLWYHGLTLNSLRICVRSWRSDYISHQVLLIPRSEMRITNSRTICAI